jgi:hypothetical protein
MPLAPHPIDQRPPTAGSTADPIRLICVYGLDPSGRVVPGEARTLASEWALGRFGPHFERGHEATIRVEAAAPWRGVALSSTPEGAAAPTGLRATLRRLSLATPMGDRLLVAEILLPPAIPKSELVAVLQGTCFYRSTMTVDGDPIGEPFAQDVHQIVCIPPGCAHLDGSALELVYRELGDHDPAYASAGEPGELNRIGGGSCRHGRGVTVMTGQSSHVQYGVAGVACHVLAAQHQLRSLRASAGRVLAEARSTEAGSPEDHLKWLAEKERQASEMRADLTFGVENYADSTLFPDMVLESYQRSLVTLMGLHDATAACDRMLDRLRDLLRVHRAEIAAELAERAQRRRRAWLIVAAFFTVLVAPLSLAFSYFGVGTTDIAGGDRHSLFSLSEFGWFWGSLAGATLLIAILAFLALTDRPHRLWTKVFDW